MIKKVTEEKRIKKVPEYRSLTERKEEVKNILQQLSKFELTPAYEPVKKLYKLFKEYIKEDTQTDEEYEILSDYDDDELDIDENKY